MTTTVEHHEHAAHAAAPPPTGWRLLIAPGWLRAAWMTALFALVGVGLVACIRALAGWDPVLELAGRSSPSRSSTVAPLGFLPGSARSTTGSTTSSAARRGPRTTRATARTAGGTTSGSTPTTR